MTRDYEATRRERKGCSNKQQQPFTFIKWSERVTVVTPQRKRQMLVEHWSVWAMNMNLETEAVGKRCITRAGYNKHVMMLCRPRIA